MWKQTILLIGGILMMAQLISSGGYDPETKTYQHTDGLTYQFTGIGGVFLWDGNEFISVIGTAYSGTVDGTPLFMDSSGFSWSWWNTTTWINNSHWENFTFYNETSEQNETDTYYVLDEYYETIVTGYNNYPSFPVLQYWTFLDGEPISKEPPKFEINVTNDLVNITNMKVYLINTISEGTTITYNGTSYTPDFTNDVYLTTNLTGIIPEVDFGNTYQFNFQDLIDSGYEITDAIVGNGSMINPAASTILLMAIGVQKNGGTFNIGDNWLLDPDVIFGYNDPSQCGIHEDDWLNCTFGFTSGDAMWTTAVDVKDFETYSFFGFDDLCDLPSSAVLSINGIEIRIAGSQAGGGVCSAAQVTAQLSSNNGSFLSYTAGKATTFNTDVPVFQVKTLGGVTNTWGRTWNKTSFCDDNFVIKFEYSKQTLLFGTCDLAILDIDVRINATLTALAPNITINAPANNSLIPHLWALLNVTVNDNELDNSQVIIYGSNKTNPTLEEMIFKSDFLPTNSTYTYNWTAPVINSSDPNLVMLLHMNKQSEFGETNTNIFDFSGSGNNATVSVVSCFQSVTNSKLGGGRKLNVGLGCTPLATVINSDSLNLSIANELTMVAWVNMTHVGSAPAIMTIARTEGFTLIPGYEWVPIFSTTINGTRFRDGNGATVNSGINQYTRGEWTHIAVTMNASDIIFYSNGEVSNSSSGSYQLITPNNNLTIGTHLGGLVAENRGINATLDEMAIYNRTWSPTEVLDHYRLKAGRYYWNVTAEDDAGGGNTSSNISTFILQDGCNFDCSFNATLTENLDCGGTNATFFGTSVPGHVVTLDANVTNWNQSHLRSCQVIHYQRLFT